MTKTIEKELKKVAFADLSNYNEETNTYFIPKYRKPKYDNGACYLVKVSKDLINNKNSVLAVNWNNGRAPLHEYYKIVVNKSVGAIINVDAVAFDYEKQADLPIMWSGWLDINKLTQLAKL